MMLKKTAEELEELSPDELTIILYRFIEQHQKDQDLDYFDKVLSYGANIESLGRSDFSLLHTVCFANYIDLLKIIIKHGAYLEITDNNGYTPLHWAAQYNRVDVIKVLIAAGADINAKDRCHNNALHQVFKGTVISFTMIESLIAAGVDLAARNILGQSFWDVAAQYMDISVITEALANSKRLSQILIIHP